VPRLDDKETKRGTFGTVSDLETYIVDLKDLARREKERKYHGSDDISPPCPSSPGRRKQKAERHRVLVLGGKGNAGGRGAGPRRRRRGGGYCIPAPP
jgi:hypothetical protein